MAEGIPARLSRRETRRFGLVVGAAFVSLAALLWWRGRAVSPQMFGAAGTALILLGILAPGALVPVYRAWMSMAAGLSKITTPIMLGIVYFGVLTPIGVTRRLFGRSPLRPQVTGDGLWVARDASGRKPEDMEHQF